MQLLKTAFPLLILSLETMLDQMLLKFKAAHEEDMYRHLSMLLHEVLQVSKAGTDCQVVSNISQALSRSNEPKCGRHRTQSPDDVHITPACPGYQ